MPGDTAGGGQPIRPRRRAALQAGLTPDRRLLVLVMDGRRHTLGRRPDGDRYGNGRYLARMDDLFLHLGIAGTLLPLHCRLLPGPERPAPG